MRNTELEALNHMVTVRRNLVGFLHMTAISNLNALFHAYYDVNGQSFNSICDTALRLFAKGVLAIGDYKAIIVLCCEENSSFRTESHRYECGSIYEYDAASGSYVHCQLGTHKEFLKLNHFLD